jgi:hypothetical protein
MSIDEKWYWDTMKMVRKEIVSAIVSCECENPDDAIERLERIAELLKIK